MRSLWKGIRSAPSMPAAEHHVTYFGFPERKTVTTVSRMYIPSWFSRYLDDAEYSVLGCRTEQNAHSFGVSPARPHIAAPTVSARAPKSRSSA